MEQVEVTSPGYKRRTGRRYTNKPIVELELPTENFRMCASCGHWEKSGAAKRCMCPCHDLGLNFDVSSEV